MLWFHFLNWNLYACFLRQLYACLFLMLCNEIELNWENLGLLKKTFRSDDMNLFCSCMHIPLQLTDSGFIDKNFQKREVWLHFLLDFGIIESMVENSRDVWFRRVIFWRIFNFSKVFIQFQTKFSVWMKIDWTNYEKKNSKNILTSSRCYQLPNKIPLMIIEAYPRDFVSHFMIIVVVNDSANKWIISFRTEDVPFRVIEILLSQIV